MSIPRSSLLARIVPAHNRLPGTTKAAWFPLHGSFAAMGAMSAPAALEVVGTEIAGKWSTTPTLYTFPTDNGGGVANVCLRVPHDEDNLLDGVFSLLGAAVGTELLIGCEVIISAQDGADGTFLCYGNNIAQAGFYRFGLGTDQKPLVGWRASGSSGSDTYTTVSTPALTMGIGGTALETLVGANRLLALMSMHVTGAAAVDVTLGFSDGTNSSVYTLTGFDAKANSGSDLPGRGVDVTHHQGLHIGGRGNSSAAADSFLGRGAGVSAKVGNVFGYRDTFDADRLATTLATWADNPAEFPQNLLEPAP